MLTKIRTKYPWNKGWDVSTLGAQVRAPTIESVIDQAQKEFADDVWEAIRQRIERRIQYANGVYYQVQGDLDYAH